jgi:hypothetical protein
MRMTGEPTSRQVTSITCPSCGETYDSPERVTEILRNSGFCVNITCLQDLTREPFEAVLSRQKDGARRSSDRRAV